MRRGGRGGGDWRWRGARRPWAAQKASAPKAQPQVVGAAGHARHRVPLSDPRLHPMLPWPLVRIRHRRR